MKRAGGLASRSLELVWNGWTVFKQAPVTVLLAALRAALILRLAAGAVLSAALALVLSTGLAVFILRFVLRFAVLSVIAHFDHLHMA